MRKEYEINEEQLKRLLEACMPVLYMWVGGLPPRSPQDNANSAWKQLGKELGFDYTTAQPVPGKSNKFFTAEAKD